MEKELNIAEILKDKPKGLKLWSPIVGECKLKDIAPDGTITIEDLRNAQYYFDYLGRLDGTIGEIILFPSKSMRDWSKFAWKKGDVLVSNGEHIIFEKWKNNSYTTFLGVFDSIDNNSLICLTSAWEKETNEVQINKYISQIEKAGGGKLNLSTLEIEKSSEFKDGDIVVLDESEDSIYVKCILILKAEDKGEGVYSFYAFLNTFRGNVEFNDEANHDGKLRLATTEEKKQLFDAIAKVNKAWDAEKKAIVNLPKKCEFKPKDWCLMRGGNEHINSDWTLCQFSHLMKCGMYRAIGGCAYNECIPYNDQTSHLLGTTDDWKGGEA